MRTSSFVLYFGLKTILNLFPLSAGYEPFQVQEDNRIRESSSNLASILIDADSVDSTKTHTILHSHSDYYTHFNLPFHLPLLSTIAQKPQF